MIDISRGVAFHCNGLDFYYGAYGGYIAEMVYRGKIKEVHVSDVEKLCVSDADFSRVVVYAMLRGQREVDRDLARRQT